MAIKYENRTSPYRKVFFKANVSTPMQSAYSELQLVPSENPFKYCDQKDLGT